MGKSDTCTRCNNRLNPTSQFCPSCGFPIAPPPKPAAKAYTIPPPRPPQPVQARHQATRRKIDFRVVIASVVGLIVLVLALTWDVSDHHEWFFDLFKGLRQYKSSSSSNAGVVLNSSTPAPVPSAAPDISNWPAYGANHTACLDRIRQEPKNPWLYYDLGEEYYYDGYHQAAITPLEVAISLDPDLLDPHMLIGFVWMELGQTDDSLEKFKYCSEIAADSDIDLEIGMYLDSLNLSQPALVYLESAVDRSPDDAYKHLVLAQAYLAAEYIGLARQEFERTLQISQPNDYEFQEAQRVLNESFSF